MKLYNKAGVNPMAGCIPGLMQAPIFYVLFHLSFGNKFETKRISLGR
jgi:membrane protein insertase Oxa1/YidC/SpoIIIJ